MSKDNYQASPDSHEDLPSLIPGYISAHYTWYSACFPFLDELCEKEFVRKVDFSSYSTPFPCQQGALWFRRGFSIVSKRYRFGITETRSKSFFVSSNVFH